jgi:sorting nexin-3/12
MKLINSTRDFLKQESSVRRRYSEFELLKQLLERENPQINIPPLPGKIFFVNNFLPGVIEKRRQGLEKFVIR